MKNTKNLFLRFIISVMIVTFVVPTFTFASSTAQSTDNSSGKVYSDSTGTMVVKDDLEPLEKGIALIFNGIANFINRAIAWALGYQVTLDDVVFNEYDPVSVDYFKGTNVNGRSSELIWGSGGSPGLSKTVNDCYSLFRGIAIIVYMVILVYMGIRIILSSTGQSMAMYKTLFMYWVVGVAILFLYPYAMKYMIQMNNTLVQIISENKGNLGDVMPSRNTMPAATTESIETIDYYKNPFNGDGTDYMSKIANDANNTKRAAIAFTYAVLSWQLLILILHYYKRLFMIGFLIAIFPLVAMFYAIDKIADGKSQAFDHWNKEFILNVFMQSFHAIVYVFVCGSVYSTSATATGFDYIVVFIGATFLFTGEEVIRKIFSQDSGVKDGAGKGLKGTAAATMIKAKLATNMITGAASKVVGKNSIPVRTFNAVKQVQASNSKLNVFDNMARAFENPNPGEDLKGTKSQLENIDSSTTMDEVQKQAAKREAVKLGNAVATLNNPKGRSVGELQEALSTIAKERENNPHNSILRDLNLTNDQLDEFDKIGAEIAVMIANGETDKVTIDRHLTMRLGYTLSDLSPEEFDKYKNMFILNMAVNGFNRYASPNDSAFEDVEEGMENINRVFASFNYKSTHDIVNEAIDRSKREKIMENAETWANSFYEDGAEATDEEKELARGIMVIANRKEGLYTAEEYLDATEKIKNNMNEDSEVAQAMMEKLGIDVDVLRHGMAHKAKETGVGDADKFDSIINEYEEDVRDGVYDDEVSAHELVKIMSMSNDAERDEAMVKMMDDITRGREESNRIEKEYTKIIANDILNENQVDVSEGRLDTNERFLNGQTRDTILEERRAAKKDVLWSLAGLKPPSHDNKTGTTYGAFSDSYKKNVENYNNHRK